MRPFTWIFPLILLICTFISALGLPESYPSVAITGLAAAIYSGYWYLDFKHSEWAKTATKPTPETPLPVLLAQRSVLARMLDTEIGLSIVGIAGMLALYNLYHQWATALWILCFVMKMYKPLFLRLTNPLPPGLKE